MKILLVHQSLQSYVAKDLAILRSKHEVRECEFIGLQRTSPLRLVTDVWMLIKGVLWADLSFSWFGKLHAFFATLLSKILRKKSIVMAGGEDVSGCYIDGKRFGLYAHPVKRRFAHLAFKWADCVVTVSQVTYDEALRNAQIPLSGAFLVYHGFDPQAFSKPAATVKERSVVTVGNIKTENWWLKGWDLFIQAAKVLPDIPFYLIGPAWEKSLSAWQLRVPDNVVLTGGLYGDELVETLARVAVYVQVSAYESFGCALAEAMLCECVPVVSRRAALPEVVGDCGLYVDELSADGLAATIQEAFSHPELGKQARQRIAEHFPLELRRERLLQIVQSAAGE